MNRNKKNLYKSIILLLVLVIGIGYAYLTSNLSISGQTEIADNTWDVHFENLVVSPGSVAATTNAVIDTNDNTKINYSIKLEKPGDYYEFTVDIKNYGTLPAKISTVTNTGISSDLEGVIDYWIGYTKHTPLKVGDILDPNMSRNIVVRVYYNEDISSSELVNTNKILNLEFNVSYIQSNKNAPIIGKGNLGFYYYRNVIKNITFEDHINIPNNASASWDVSEAGNGSVMAYVVPNSEETTKYDLYIQGEGGVIANQNSSGLFKDMTIVDSINNLDLLDTSNVTDMSNMFNNTGSNSQLFTLDLGNNFDTSKVTDMNNMFTEAARNCPVFTLDLGNKFDTSKVTDMHYMFNWTGRVSTVLTLDLGNYFDTSNVTSASYIFRGVGYGNPNFTINLGNKFYSNNIENISYGFQWTGYANDNLVLDLSSFDFTQISLNNTIFEGIKATQKIYVKDVENRDYILNNSNYNNLSTSNLLVKP